MKFSIEVYDTNGHDWVQLEPVYDHRSDRDEALQELQERTTLTVDSRYINTAVFRTKSWDENNPIYKDKGNGNG